MKYQPVKKKPVAKFWYKGNHTHPVRRTILVIDSDKSVIRGYELREGNITRSLKKAPIKSYRRDRIASAAQLRLDSPLRRQKSTASTYTRSSLLEIIESGV